MYGDNKTVVTSSSILKSEIHNRHVVLSYHRVREAIAADVLKLLYLLEEYNAADILSKTWKYSTVRNTLLAL